MEFIKVEGDVLWISVCCPRCGYRGWVEIKNPSRYSNVLLSAFFQCINCGYEEYKSVGKED